MRSVNRKIEETKTIVADARMVVDRVFSMVPPGLSNIQDGIGKIGALAEDPGAALSKGLESVA